MPQVALFGACIRELLAQPLATDERGCLTPAVLGLSPRTAATCAPRLPSSPSVDGRGDRHAPPAPVFHHPQSAKQADKYIGSDAVIERLQRKLSAAKAGQSKVKAPRSR